MAKKLFIVRAEIETVVLANDENDAREVAVDNRDDIFSEAELSSPHSWDAQPCKILPSHWDEDSLPWKSYDYFDGDVTVGQYMKEAKAQLAKEASDLAEEIMANMEIDD